MLQTITNIFQQYSDKSAFCIAGQRYSYEELGYYVAGIRHLLQQAKPDAHFINLIAYDSIETYAAILAIWLEGYAFVPLSPLSPKDRNTNIMLQVESKWVLSSEAAVDKIIDPKAIQLIHTKDVKATSSNWEIVKKEEDQIICMLFTSGSTGLPKGVPYTSKNIHTTMDAFLAQGYQVNHQDRFLQMFELTFDMSLLSYLSAWYHGAEIYTLGYDHVKYLKAYQLIQEHHLTFVTMVPSTLNFLRPYFKQMQLPSVKYSLIGGEPFYKNLAEGWMTCVPNATVINISGPCETTMLCVSYDLSRDFSKNKTHKDKLAFGSTWKNTISILIDDDLNQVKNGQEGELCFAGDNVMQGYWKLPERNKSVFFEKELDGQKHRFYRSGDMAFVDAEGILHTCGRKDHQHKILGYKVELGEIEQLSRSFTNSNSVAIVDQLKNGVAVIYLFVEKNELEQESLMNFLEQKLPPYMVPKKIINMVSFPTTISGKVDRKQLLTMINQK